MTKAFETTGFVYLRNHGIPDKVIDNMSKSSATFFDLPQREKDKFARDSERVHGYVGLSVNREKLDPSDNYKNELRESYDLRSVEDFFPDNLVPSFRPAVDSYLSACQTLVRRLLIALAIGLELERNFFLDAHKYLGTGGNSSIARILHYPPVSQETVKDSIRCGAHCDYGSLTLLFQDEMGGLNVRNCDGEWVSVEPVPGTVLVNIGDLLELWTSKRLLATEHRVVVPANKARQQRSRRSMAYFCHPDDDYLVKPLDGSTSFEPITGLAYMKKRHRETCKY